MEKHENQPSGLPENAFRELKEGEQYAPLMSPDKTYKEVTTWSVLWGILMAVLFSAASAYLGLKVGQVFEAAIPITIIAIGLAGATHRKGALGENVIIQSIGACSGMVVAGAIFTLPALYILQDKYPEMTVDFLEVFIASVLGGVLGILFLIPFRKYFVKDMHGKYPFPEATASTQVLVSGEKGGSQARPLLIAGLVGGLYDFIIATVGWWNESFTTRCFEWGQLLADKAKLVFKINTGAAVLGMGYIVGLKYALIICCGSVAVWWVIIPAIPLLFPGLDMGDGVAASAASAEQIFQYAKSIGIGGIAMAGVIGILKSRKIIGSAIGLAAQEMKGKGKSGTAVPRTQRDLSMKIVVVGSLAAIVAIEPGGAPEVDSDAYSTMVEQNIPVTFYYGDYIGEEFTDVPAAAMWSMMAASADTFTEAYNAAGGSSTVVHLPDEGITGNDHFMFQDLNNDVIADHIEAWIQENVTE